MELVGDIVQIEITDNGEGISEEDLENIDRNIGLIMQGKGFDMEGHIGLMNTVSRLYLHYGNTCSFSVELSRMQHLKQLSSYQRRSK
jgi:sensor histidine kinase YesM